MRENTSLCRRRSSKNEPPVRIAINGVRAVFHRPHPQKETDRGAVASMLRFLVEAGIGVEGKK